MVIPGTAVKNPFAGPKENSWKRLEKGDYSQHDVAARSVFRSSLIGCFSVSQVIVLNRQHLDFVLSFFTDVFPTSFSSKV